MPKLWIFAVGYWQETIKERDIVSIHQKAVLIYSNMKRKKSLKSNYNFLPHGKMLII